jgi:hypothetical protein
MTTRSTTKARRSASYLLDVVDDDLGEATSEDTERGQDGTKRVDPHEVDLSLWNELQRTQEVSRNMSWKECGSGNTTDLPLRRRPDRRPE